MTTNEIDIYSGLMEITDPNEFLDYAWLDLDSTDKIRINNRMLTQDWEDRSKTVGLIVQMCRNPEYMQFICKYILKLNLVPLQFAILRAMWKHPFIAFVASRGSGKSFLIAIYCILRCLLHQGCTICVVGASFRQSMVIFNYIQKIWNDAPILRDICGKKNEPKRELHLASWTCGRSKINFLPLGTGETIRGQRANIIVADEFGSVDPTIFETVVRGFASTKSDGVFENIVKVAKERELIKRGILLKSEKGGAQFNNIPTMLGSNQIIMAGTASFQFNHFYKYFSQYETILRSGGDLAKIKEAFPDMEIDSDLNPEHYATIQLPYTLVPDGMMDKAVLLQGRAMMDNTIFLGEYGALFAKDSDGFILASWIQNATCPVLGTEGNIDFFARLNAQGSGGRFVMGIDPASEDDNFIISIVEIHKNYRGLVYVWSTTRKEFERLQRDGLVGDANDYMTYCIRHIRDLRNRFNIELIFCDAAGGGIHIKEALKDKDKIPEGEKAILDMDDEHAKRQQGEAILKLANFSDGEWRKEAHYALRKDITDKVLLFPNYDAAGMEISKLEDRFNNKKIDTLDDCYFEINETRTETILIKVSHSANNTERWDVPNIMNISSEEVKKKLKKDRFTALLLANYAARLLIENKVFSTPDKYKVVKRGVQYQTGVDKPAPRVQISNGRSGRKICR